MEQTLKGKLPQNVTYNRPQSYQRAPDPGRFRSIDIQPENAQNDPEYQRMVRDIEALQHRQGWLAGRGAFDKEDLLYLRDREQQERLTEQEQRDMEAAAYAAARARIEQQQAEAARASLRAASAKQNKPQNRPFAPVVKVKAQHTKDKQQFQEGTVQQQHAPPDPQLDERGSKRQKLVDISHAATVEGTAKQLKAVADAITKKGDEHQPNQVPPAVPAVSQPAKPSTAAYAIAEVSELSIQQPIQAEQQHHVQQLDAQHMEPSSGDAGLAGLLGVYGSDSDSESEGDEDRTKAIAQRKPSVQIKLPPAAEMLEQEVHSSFAGAAAADAAAQPEAGGIIDAVAQGVTKVYQQHTGWI